MVRTQILLTNEQATALREAAAKDGRSMADLVREGVDAVLSQRHVPGRSATKRRSLAAIGKFRSGTPDLATKHDAHLADAFGS